MTSLYMSRRGNKFAIYMIIYVTWCSVFFFYPQGKSYLNCLNSLRNQELIVTTCGLLLVECGDDISVRDLHSWVVHCYQTERYWVVMPFEYINDDCSPDVKDKEVVEVRNHCGLDSPPLLEKSSLSLLRLHRQRQLSSTVRCLGHDLWC